MLITKQVNLIISVFVALIGVFVCWGAINFDTDGGLFEGARLLPSITGAGLILLAVALLAGGADQEKPENISNTVTQEDAEDDTEEYGWRGLKTVAIPLTATVLLYVGLLSGFGYLLATVLISTVFFRIFGNRGILHGLVLPVVMAVVFYVVFFIILGLFDPPGEILDLSEIFNR